MSTPKSVLELAKKSGAKMVDIKFVDTFGGYKSNICMNWLEIVPLRLNMLETPPSRLRATGPAQSRAMPLVTTAIAG